MSRPTSAIPLRVPLSLALLLVIMLVACSAPGIEVFLLNHNGSDKTLLPCYLWTCGCSPTAAAMALGYWDNYSSIGGGQFYKYQDWGELTHYYMDEQAFESYKGSDSLPYNWEVQGCLARSKLILDLAMAMGTRGGGATPVFAVAPGITSVARARGYGPSSWSELHLAHASNEWLFPLLVGEISENRPSVWNISGHSLCAWGFTDSREVIVYNTWDEMRHDYDYRQCNSICTVLPSAGTLGEDVELISPDGGGSYCGGETLSIDWIQYGFSVDRLDIYTSMSGGHDTSWVQLATDVPSNEGSNFYEWTTPDTVSSERMRIMIKGRDAAGTVYGSDGSRANSAIAPPVSTIAVSSPEGGECWIRGTSHVLRWATTGECGNVRVELYRSGSPQTTLTVCAPDESLYVWNIPEGQVPSREYGIRVSAVDDSSLFDESDSSFAIPQRLTVFSPNGGEVWYAGQVHEITWEPSGIGGEVSVMYSADAGSTWDSVVSAMPDYGSHNWTVPDSPTTHGRIRVSHSLCSENSDDSDADFELALGSLAVTSPNGGECWIRGSRHEITWSSVGVSGGVKLELYRGGSLESTIADSTLNDSLYTWDIPSEQTPADDYTVQLSSLKVPSVLDLSDSGFTIPRHLEILSPNGGEVWYSGDEHEIVWVTSGVSNTATILFTADAGSTWDTVCASAPDNGSYLWTVPGLATEHGVISVVCEMCPANRDESDSSFTVQLTGIDENTLNRHPEADAFSLGRNYPNPVLANTTIGYSIPRESKVRLALLDITGREVAVLVDDSQTAGYHQIRWNRKGNPSGIYFYRLRAGEFVETRKMVVVE